MSTFLDNRKSQYKSLYNNHTLFKQFSFYINQQPNTTKMLPLKIPKSQELCLTIVESHGDLRECKVIFATTAKCQLCMPRALLPDSAIA
ncbi:GAL10 protein [Sesbania bispinosa]|nr:GAL10 protein [Sesbania bispinosa]